MDSILTSIKKMLGIAEEYTHFDADIIMHINTAFMTLTQIGVGPKEGYLIIDAVDEWTDFLPTSMKLEGVKTYVYLKVRLVFDPPQSSTAIDAINRQIAELEWRLNVMVDPGEEENQNG